MEFLTHYNSPLLWFQDQISSDNFWWTRDEKVEILQEFFLQIYKHFQEEYKYLGFFFIDNHQSLHMKKVKAISFLDIKCRIFWKGFMNFISNIKSVESFIHNNFK